MMQDSSGDAGESLGDIHFCSWNVTTNLIIGGNFNCVLDYYLDKSSAQAVTSSSTSKLLNTYIKNMNLCDIWRLTNPTGREYSLHSHVHNV